MKLHTTLNLLRKNGACATGYAKVVRRVGLDYDKDAAINLLTILDSNGVSDAVWALRSCTDSDKASSVSASFAAWCSDAAAAAAAAAAEDDVVAAIDAVAVAAVAAGAAAAAAVAAIAADAVAAADAAAVAEDAAIGRHAAGTRAKKLKELLT